MKCYTELVLNIQWLCGLFNLKKLLPSTLPQNASPIAIIHINLVDYLLPTTTEILLILL